MASIARILIDAEGVAMLLAPVVAQQPLQHSILTARHLVAEAITAHS